MVTTEDFQKVIKHIFAEAEKKKSLYIEVRSGDLHSRLGATARLPSCCNAMYGFYNPPSDEIIKAPRKGKGANLIIRYRIPRNAPNPGKKQFH